MTRPDLDAILPPVSAEDEATVDALLAKAREGVGKRPIGGRPDLDAIRARNMVDWLGNGKEELSGDVAALLAYIDELESCTAFTTSYIIGETEWAQRIATLEHMLAEERENVDTLRREIEHGNQRFVDEYDAHQETRQLLTNLYMKQLRSDAAQMREYGISYAGLRQLLAEYDGGDLSLGKVLDLLRAAARELAKEEVAELKARIATLEAMR